MRCCGSSYHAITVHAGSGAVALLRCPVCGDQKWAADGTVVARSEAFDLLARAYRDVPVRAHTARERAAVASSARRAARIAGQEADRAAAAADTDGPDAARLLGLLDGWQLLGATA